MDHQPLAWLLNCRKPNARLARWLIRLSNYDFKIIYRSGKTHGNADALSRWALEEPDSQDNVDGEPDIPVVINKIKVNVITGAEDVYGKIEPEWMDQTLDPDLKWVIDLKKSGALKESIVSDDLSEGQKALLKFYDYFILV